MENLTRAEITKEYIFEKLENQSSSEGSLIVGHNLTISIGITPVQAILPIPVRIYIWTITSASVVGIIGNLLVLMVYLRNFRYITPFKFLIGHLALCDCLFSFAQVFNVVASDWCTGRVHWMINLELCKITRGSVQLGSLVSVGTILAITIERFHGITQGMPSNARRNAWKKVLTVVCLIWIVAVSSTIPIYMSAEVVEKECEERWKKHFGKESIKIYFIYLLLVFCLIPMVAMSFMNGMIICRMKKPSQCNNLYKNMLEDMAKLRKRRDMRATKILVTVIIIFFLCVLPIRILCVVSSFPNLMSLENSPTWSIFYTAKLSYPFHVAVNPIIYSIIDKAFRKELFRTFLCCGRETFKNDTSRLMSRNNNKLTSLKVCIREQKDDLETSDLLAIPTDLKYSLLFPELHQMTNEEEKHFHRETFV